MTGIYFLRDAKGQKAPRNDQVVWEEGAQTALYCYTDKSGTEQMYTKMVEKSSKGYFVLVNGKRLYVAEQRKDTI